MNPDALRTVIRDNYGDAAVHARAGVANTCCGGSAAPESSGDPISNCVINLSANKDRVLAKPIEY